MHCSRHDLSAGPDGRCVLCRREGLADERKAARRLGFMFMAGIVAVAGALLLARPLRRSLQSEAVPVAESAAAGAEAVVVDRVPSRAAPAVAERRDWSTPGATPERVPAPPAAALAQPLDSGAESGTAAVASARPPPSAAEIASAKSATRIRMFSTSWCPVCTKARAFMNANQLSYTELDIDHDEAAREELKRRSGASSIPTIEIEGEMLRPGFSESAIVSAVAASVEKRLGVSGIRAETR